MIYQDKEKLETLIAPILEKEGFVLFDINISQSRQGSVVRLLVDKEKGGISLGECARLGENFRSLVENWNLFSAGFSLEVSSPGADRPLKTKKDFIRAFEKKARFLLSEAVSGKKEITGVVLNATDDFVLVGFNQSEINIPIKNIIVAKQVI